MSCPLLVLKSADSGEACPQSGLSGSPQKVCLRPLVRGMKMLGLDSSVSVADSSVSLRASSELCTGRRMSWMDSSEHLRSLFISCYKTDSRPDSLCMTIVPWHWLNLSYVDGKGPWSMMFDLPHQIVTVALWHCDLLDKHFLSFKHAAGKV